MKSITTIRQGLRIIRNIGDPQINDEDKWTALSIVLEEFMLAQGVDLDQEIEKDEEIR